MTIDQTQPAQASIVRQLWQAMKLLPALLVAALASTAVHAQTATFTLQDSTNLTPGTYQIYVTGYSTAGPYVLQSDGSWGAPAAPTPPATTATLPCYRFPQEISQVQINGAQTSISARVYYFVVTDTTRFPSCAPVFSNQGTCSGVTVTATSITMASGSAIPPGGCTIVVPIASSTSGTVVNTTSALSTSGGSAAAASAPLTVVSGSGPTLVKAIAPTALPAPGTATLTLTIGNPGTASLTLTSPFTDTMPAGVTTGGNTGTCTGVTVTPTTITMASGSTIPPGGCNIVTTITASTTGTLVNTTSALSTSGGSAAAASAPLTVGSGSGPTLVKAIAPPTIATLGGSATLTLTLGNPGGTPLTLTAPFTDTMPAGVAISEPGLFNVPNAFTYTSAAILNLVEPSASLVTDKSFPAWAFSEIGASSTSGTMDLSQVDFLAFPMSTTATVSAVPSAPPKPPDNPPVIGNPVGAADNPGDVVNHLSMRDNYSAFINGLAQAGNGHKSCSTDSTPMVCAYLDLLQGISTPGSAVPQYVIQNPGGFLAANTAATQASRLNTVFDGVIGTLWATTGAPTLTINTGGTLGGVPQDTFTSSIVTLTYPGSSPPFSITAMKFTGASTGYVAYVFSPKGFETGCNLGAIPIADCTIPASSGYQVFGGAGALGTPSAATYNNFASSLPPATTAYGSTGYINVVGRLAFLISAAMNRGVALVTCSQTYTWQCWQDETYWYPTKTTASDPTSIFPDITQNLFSQWMHIATIGGTPMFKRPPGAVKSASGTAGTGRIMGMAYGFADDEDPTPSATTPAQPKVPSKMDQTILYGGAGPYTITFGPWVAAAATPTLSVVNAGGGTVTSSPAGINCGSTCSQSYPAGTTVVLTATPDKSALFHGWTGACTGGSTTCTVALNASASVTAEFAEILAAPSKYGLHVVVNGAGTVTSSPAGISCGSACGAAFAANSSVTLSAVSAAGWSFAGWSGACSGAASPCTVTMSEARNVGAAFVDNAHFALTVTGGNGGIVTTTPGGIDCGTRCSAGFAAGTTVNAIARPNPGYRFAGWTGACAGTSTCDLTMNANKAVQASFTAIAPGHHTLTVHDYGDGTITSLPPGINCGNTCSAAFVAGAEVLLTATPAPGQRFAGWTGACTGVGACTVWMGNVEHVNATFVPDALPVASPIPTLSQWALLLLGLLIAGVVYQRLRVRPSRRAGIR